MKSERFDQMLVSLNKAIKQAKSKNNESWNDSLTCTLPEQINSVEESDAWAEILNELFNIGEDNLTPEKNALFIRVADLIEDYEDRTLEPIPAFTPVELLASLMEQNNLEPRDLADIFASPLELSDVLSGNGRITRTGKATWQKIPCEA